MYCELCRYSIQGSVGFFGRFLKETGKAYCFTCYPKAVDMYIADLRLERAKVEQPVNETK